MKLTIRDAASAVLVAAILVPYVGYLWQGEMPFIEDPRGMSAVALVLGAAAFLSAGRLFSTGRIGRIEAALAAAVLVLGVVALVFAEAAAAEALLATFIVAIVVVWGVQMLHHAGIIPMGRDHVAHR